MRGLLSRIVGDANERELKKLRPLIQKINELEDRMKELPDSVFPRRTAELKEQVRKALAEDEKLVAGLRQELREGGEGDRQKTRSRLEEAEKKLLLAQQKVLDSILPEAFAMVREASRRVLGMRHFDVQLLGGIVLHQGRIAEMKTGEGKTLVATLPAYLNALTGRGVHIVTVNDYLARRDRDWMGPVYKFLGLSVGLIVHGLAPEERRRSYYSDITYGTNNEFGFDYLRDNMVLYKEQLVQRELHYAIVDEVDSILVDEARTPLIISGQAEQSTGLYRRFAMLVPQLKRDVDYTVDEKAHTVILTEEGEARAERLIGVENLADEKNMELRHHLMQALKAHALMKRDRDYVVKDGEVIIVDEFTGRLMFGRRYSDGLHQAIEAKEGVKVARETMTLASITFQNFFRMYKKLAGMTGTAATEEEEFQKIYGMDVVVIPTNKEMIRVDLPDVIYKTERAKLRAVVEEIVNRHQKGQPLLVGTISIEKSEELSNMLKKRGIPHQVLNAKHHEREANIIAQAGRLGAVTIATNMAGRGTDILLGGNPEVLAKEEFAARHGKPYEEYTSGLDDKEAAQARKELEELLEKNRQLTAREKERVVELGGLHIIGTERHEARRIDNQLRGRAGRQGDPGSSQFFISLEDDLMRLFGSDNIMGLMDKLGLDEDTPIDHPLISKAIENAQKRVEARNFDIRKHILEYDNVINEQREIIYSQRRRVLDGENLRGHMLEMITGLVDEALDLYAPEKMYEEEWNLGDFLKYAESTFLLPGQLKLEDLTGKDRHDLREMVLQAAFDNYAKRESALGEEIMRELERVILLRTVDSKWMNHIDAMDDLRQGIGLRAYGQRDPLLAYKAEAYEMFQEMIHSIREDVVRMLLRVQVSVKPTRQAVAVVNETPAADGTTAQPVKKKEKEPGRNDPCPCGSGKKYKKCCGK